MHSLELICPHQSIFDDDILDDNGFIAIWVEAVATDVNGRGSFNLGDGHFTAVSALEDNDVGEGKAVHSISIQKSVRFGSLASWLNWKLNRMNG